MNTFVTARRIGLVLPMTVALSIFAAGAGRAADLAAEPFSVDVSLNGLDLTTPDGQEAARHRVRRAAIAACGMPDMRDLRELTAFDDCRDAAVANAGLVLDQRIASAQSAAALRFADLSH